MRLHKVQRHELQTDKVEKEMVQKTEAVSQLRAALEDKIEADHIDLTVVQALESSESSPETKEECTQVRHELAKVITELHTLRDHLAELVKAHTIDMSRFDHLERDLCDRVEIFETEEHEKLQVSHIGKRKRVDHDDSSKRLRLGTVSALTMVSIVTSGVVTAGMQLASRWPSSALH